MAIATKERLEYHCPACGKIVVNVRCGVLSGHPIPAGATQGVEYAWWCRGCGYCDLKVLVVHVVERYGRVERRPEAEPRDPDLCPRLQVYQ